MKDPVSPLRTTFERLCCAVQSDAGVICLRRDGEEEERCISFADFYFHSLPAAEAKPALVEAARKTCETKQTQNKGDVLSFPLSADKAEVFGSVSFLHGTVSNPEQLEEALAAFSKATYGELLEGFLDSCAPETLRSENICMKYSDDVFQTDVLDNVCLSIRSGQLTIIMGRSGSGKSSLLNIIGGLLTPTRGSLWWKGKNIAAFTPKQKTAYRRNTTGFIFQNYNLISDLTALENVEVAVSLASEADSAEQLLAKVGLENKLHSYPTQMSGGEQQRVSIARALVKRPEILLCDEPTGALDTENAKRIMILLQTIVHRRNIAVIVVTHNPEYIPLADHYIKMENGKVLTDRYQLFPYSAEDIL